MIFNKSKPVKLIQKVDFDKCSCIILEQSKFSTSIQIVNISELIDDQEGFDLLNQLTQLEWEKYNLANLTKKKYNYE